MRIALPVLCVLLFAGGAAAAPPPQCKYLDSRLAYYETQLDRAKALDSELWVARLETHIDALDEFRDDIGCPDNSTVAEEVARTLNKILELAAQGAITFFTMGAM
jgi:hypothetical protein